MPIKDKLKHINNLLFEIDDRKNKQYINYIKKKKIDNATKIIISILNSISISSLISGFSGLLPFTIVSLVSSSLSALLFAAINSYNLSDKISKYNNSYQQYGDLHRWIAGVIKKNHLESNDYDELINNINEKLSLIEDSSIN